MKRIAFALTEYQQNIVAAICLQNAMRMDIVFVQRNIQLNRRFEEFADQVILLDNIPYSWRSISKFYKEFKKVISPLIRSEEEYMVFAHSIEHPLIRMTVGDLKKVSMDLFEDGTGSYVSWGIFFKNLGIKAFLSSFAISSGISLLTFNVSNPRRLIVRGWSLFSGCFPEFNIEKKLIEHGCFQSAVKHSMPDSVPVSLEVNTKVFIQQPYVEMTILNDDEYVEIHTQAVLKIKQSEPIEIIEVIWKLHPRTNVANEQKRLDEISKATGVRFQIVQDRWNMEHIAYANRKNNIQYFSLGSSSLYVVKALTSGTNATVLVKNEMLNSKLPSQTQVNELYQSIGIGFL